MRQTLTAALLTLTCCFPGCQGEQVPYDDQARATDPATQTPAPTEDAMPDTDRDQALAAYNAALMDDSPKVQLTDDQWKAILSDEEFRILRRSGTERIGTGRYLDNDEPGSYHCAGCGLYLYDAKHKFHSGCGWPSFNQEVGEDVLTYIQDNSHGMTRTEMRCARCDGHMGHVFNDAPDQPTGIRHCVNGGAIIFIPEGEDPQAVIAQHREQHAER